MSKKTILTIKKLSKSFGEHQILKDVNLSISEGEKVGLVGANGSGKSTLFKLLAGELEHESGSIHVEAGYKVAYLPQIHNLGNMSGGEEAKHILKNITHSKGDIYLLDEPTNNLDEEGLVSIEKFIKENPKTFIIISHDRTFLDRVVEKIIEIDHYQKTIFVYSGNYTDYMEARKKRIENVWDEYKDSKGKKKRIEGELSQRIDWLKKIEKKRHGNRDLPMHVTKPDAAYLRDMEGAAGRRIKATVNKLDKHKEKQDESVKPKEELPLTIEFENERGSTKVFELQNVVKIMDDRSGGINRQIGPINEFIQYGDRIRITGKNGRGKTTFIKMLLQEIKPNSGDVIVGENVRIGYIPQSRNINDEQTALEYFMEKTEWEQTESRKLLNYFRITAEDVHKRLKDLSPGEYSRLLISTILVNKPNCIILDEPSNHLDLEVLEELEAGLLSYKGTLIVVSHDRYFIGKLGDLREIRL